VDESRPPYRLSFDMRVSAVLPLELLEAQAYGELNGVGRWLFDDQNGLTVCATNGSWRRRSTG
jgi:hypothetical protein